MRARLLTLVLVHLIVSACGTGVFVHTLEIAVSDPTGRLGPPPVEIGIFDHTMGRSEEWARRTAGTAAPGAPYRGEHRAVETKTVLDSSPSRRVAVGVWLPAYHSAGFFQLVIEPGTNAVQRVTLPFVPWADSYPEGRTVIPLAATVRSEAVDGAWALRMTIEVPPKPD
ncbi:MAG: hypothetical protein IT179_16930 [Acidobacteria bacterium]|nr:hypothetical protein [Acidobacteriota bacterium]